MIRATAAILAAAIAAVGPAFSAVLIRTGPELEVNTFTQNDQLRPAVAGDAEGDGDFIVVWQSRYQDGDN